jgi:uncharacterized protein YodC (DUF2158 family)
MVKDEFASEAIGLKKGMMTQKTDRLKSGGPLHGATSVTGESVTCEWFDTQDQAQSRTFKTLALAKDSGVTVCT